MDRSGLSETADEMNDQPTESVRRRQLLKASGAGLVLLSGPIGSASATDGTETWDVHDFLDEYVQITSDRRAVSALLSLDDQQRQKATEVLRHRLQATDGEISYTPPVRVALTHAALN